MTNPEPLSGIDSAGFGALLATMRALRDPDTGCPWDLVQTYETLRGTLLEETYEALEALASGDTGALVEELGDVLLQVVLSAQIGSDAGTFNIADVVDFLNRKLVRRHPHVFGEAHAKTAAEGIGHWERMKATERADKGQADKSMLDGVPKAMPALAYANAVLGRARRAGFDWDNPDAIFDKIGEELRELAAEDSPARKEEEFGDVLLAAVGAAVRMGIDPEQALRGANARFYERFTHVERAAHEQGTTLAAMPTDDKLALWEAAKEAQ
ncbi:MAG: nucleoside triphosphate pyrophosphohydrolase [Chloroflexi bacterium]|nr:nucleoside triphosphate pyrophosphohydrolase [Chloroflexota bacterium]